MDRARETHARGIEKLPVCGGPGTMKLTQEEIGYLAAWSREEWEPDCYRRPAHRLQLSHGVVGADLIDLIKAWTEAEQKKDHEILHAADNPDPSWPWRSAEQFRARLHEAQTSARQDQAPATVQS